MRIAQVAPLYESVPPKLYGGTERVVSYLTEALVDLGHEVTLYASGDSITRARLRAVRESGLRLDKTSVDPCADHVYLAERIFQEAAEYEFIHSHIDYLALPLLRRMRTPHATTLHGRLDIPNLRNLYHEFRDEPLISISDYQRFPLPWACWQATIYHGLPENLYRFRDPPGQYLACLGRISPEKRMDHAIQIAKRAGVPLKIAAKVDKADQEYFETTIKPLLDQSGVEFIGEIGEAAKDEFLGNALALLFPIDWPEPFGLVMIEALACGTPVIARSRGSVPEIIEHGATGFIINDIEEGVEAVKNIHRLSRKNCRQTFQQRFTATRMAEDYIALYQRLVHARSMEDNEPKAESLSRAGLDDQIRAPRHRERRAQVSGPVTPGVSRAPAPSRLSRGGPWLRPRRARSGVAAIRTE
jgi:glycosyltransferase involved in cell wall biosynthesis